MTQKSSLLSLTAVIVLSALLTAFSPTSHTPAAVAAIPQNERAVAEAAIDQFIVHGRPYVQAADYVWEYPAGAPVLVSEPTWGEDTTAGIKIAPGQAAAFTDYVDRNRRPRIWECAPVLTVSSEVAPPTSN